MSTGHETSGHVTNPSLASHLFLRTNICAWWDKLFVLNPTGTPCVGSWSSLAGFSLSMQTFPACWLSCFNREASLLLCWFSASNWLLSRCYQLGTCLQQILRPHICQTIFVRTGWKLEMTDQKWQKKKRKKENTTKENPHPSLLSASHVKGKVVPKNSSTVSTFHLHVDKTCLHLKKIAGWGKKKRG